MAHTTQNGDDLGIDVWVYHISTPQKAGKVMMKVLPGQIK